jgi:HK97 family phage major capsid protein
MNKKMRELLSKIAQKRAAAKEFMKDGEGKDLEKATVLLNEADELQKEFDLEARMYETEKEDNTPSEEELNAEKGKKEEESKEKKLATGIRNVMKGTALNETTGTEGGFTVPQDISTTVEELRSAVVSLVDFVRTENVSTNSGRRTFKTRKQAKGFNKVGEKGKIAQSDTPDFSKLEYAIAKYAGYLPVTNELLEDSDANIYDLIVNWLADESRATRNNLILEAIKTKAAEALDGLDGIKKALNVTLGQAFKATSRIFTNDDGLQYLDTLKDDNGRYLLQPNPSDPAQMRLAAGATTVPVVVIPNDVLATTEGKVPFIIGDLKEGVVIFDRNQVNIISSSTASVTGFNAFEEDMTLLRAIEREDVKVRDEAAFVNGYITVEETA